jgi:hypothetical protein
VSVPLLLSVVAEERAPRGIVTRPTGQLPRVCDGLPTRPLSPRTGLTLRSGWSQRRDWVSGVVLDGRATSVPFTAVLNGPERTTTDNHQAAPTCAAPHPRRWQQRPNWLWEQGVAGSNPAVRPPARTPWPTGVPAFSSLGLVLAAVGVQRGLQQSVGRAGGGSASTGCWPASRCIAGSTFPASSRPPTTGRGGAQALC